MKGIQFFVHSLLPKRVSMGLTIGVRFIEGGKRKRAVIIRKIKGEECLPEWNDEIQDQQVTQERVVPQDPR